MQIFCVTAVQVIHLFAEGASQVDPCVWNNSEHGIFSKYTSHNPNKNLNVSNCWCLLEFIAPEMVSGI